MVYRDTASFGRRQEYVAIAELLRREFDVYATLVDDQGIDCVVRLDASRYLDVQTKARSRTARNPCLFPGLQFEVRPNFFFVFYTELTSHFWTMPSSLVAAHGTQTTSGKHRGSVALHLPTNDRADPQCGSPASATRQDSS
jgi:hypothetical protein